MRQALFSLIMLSLIASGSFFVPFTFAQETLTPTENYGFVNKWGSQTDHALLYSAKVATDQSGNLYVLTIDVREFVIQKYDPNGTAILEFGRYGEGYGKTSSPMGIAADPSGEYIYVSDQGGKILKFKSDGTFVKQWNSLGSGDGELSQFVEGVAVDREGNVYVADAGNSRIQKFSPEGSFLAKWGSDGSGDGQFSRPYSIAFAPDGSIYVDDLGNRRIQKFSSDGKFMLKWTPGGDPVGIAVDSNGNVYVVPQSTGVVQKFNPNGQFISEFNGTTLSPTYLYVPNDVAVDPEDNIYTALQNSGVQKFDKDGAYISSIFVTKEGIGNFRSPKGIAVDSDSDYVYVLDDVDLRVQKFAGSGEFISQWNLAVEASNEANDIAVENDGSVYVIWDGVKKFSPDGLLVSSLGPRGEGLGEINGARAVALDDDRNLVYVASNYKIQQFTPEGRFVSEWEAGDTGKVSGQQFFVDDIAVDSEGRVYALGFHTNIIEVFGPDGKSVGMLDFSSQVPIIDGQPANAFRIAIDHSDRLYVCYFDGTIRKYNLQGDFIAQITSRGSEDGKVTFPTGIAINKNSGLIYVADGGNIRVQVFGAVESSQELGSPIDLGSWIIVIIAAGGVVAVVIVMRKYRRQ